MSYTGWPGDDEEDKYMCQCQNCLTTLLRTPCELDTLRKELTEREDAQVAMIATIATLTAERAEVKAEVLIREGETQYEEERRKKSEVERDRYRDALEFMREYAHEDAIAEDTLRSFLMGHMNFGDDDTVIGEASE